MAKLPPIDAELIWIRDLLHGGKRPEALARLDAHIAKGTASAEAIALRDSLRSAKRGRQPFGGSHLWHDIGADNDEMRTDGVTYAARMDHLAAKYMLGTTRIETAIAKYEHAMKLNRQENQ